MDADTRGRCLQQTERRGGVRRLADMRAKRKRPARSILSERAEEGEVERVLLCLCETPQVETSFQL